MFLQNIKLHHFLGTNSTTHKIFLVPWAKKIENESKGRIKINIFPSEMIGSVFNIKESEPIILVEHKDKYFLIELVKTEDLIKNLNDSSIRKKVISDLKSKVRRNYISDIVNKIRNNEFNKN